MNGKRIDVRSTWYGERVVNTRANLSELSLAAAEGTPPVQWRVSDAPVAYNAALAAMDGRVDAIVARRAPEQVWLL
jgi:lipoyl(octanoyl) transferase